MSTRWTRKRELALAFALAAAGATAARAAGEPAELVGDWRGESRCIDRVVAPACQDEVVIYTFRAGAAPGEVILSADKVVAGERLAMGELTFAWEPASGQWVARFRSRRYETRWELTVAGDSIDGRAVDAATGAAFRAVRVRREPDAARR